MLGTPGTLPGARRAYSAVFSRPGAVVFGAGAGAAGTCTVGATGCAGTLVVGAICL